MHCIETWSRWRNRHSVILVVYLVVPVCQSVVGSTINEVLQTVSRCMCVQRDCACSVVGHVQCIEKGGSLLRREIKHQRKFNEIPIFLGVRFFY